MGALVIGMGQRNDSFIFEKAQKLIVQLHMISLTTTSIMPQLRLWPGQYLC